LWWEGLPEILLVGGDCDGRKGGDALHSLPQWAVSWEECTRGYYIVPSYLPPRTLGVGRKWAKMVLGGIARGGGVRDGAGPAIGW
jgi:hypothetical protein